MPAEPVQDGYLLLSDAPGLGYRLNPDVLGTHRATDASTVDSTKVVPAS
jgi:hypothetical protein